MWTIQILGGCVNVNSFKRKKKARKYKKYIFCDKFYRCNKIGFSSFHFLWQPELHYQCTIQFRRGRLHNLWENRLDCFNLNVFSELLYLFCKTFWICFAFYSENRCKSCNGEWPCVLAPLITSEFRTMMRKKLTNSQLIMMSRNVRICLTKFPHRCVTWNQDVWYLYSDDCDDHLGRWLLRSKTSVTWLPKAGRLFKQGASLGGFNWTPWRLNPDTS